MRKVAAKVLQHTLLIYMFGSTALLLVVWVLVAVVPKLQQSPTGMVLPPLTAILNLKGHNSGGRPPNLGCRRQPTGEAGVGILKLVGDSWGMIGILRDSLG